MNEPETRIEALADQLLDIEAAIEEAKDVIRDAPTSDMAQMALDAKVDLLAQRQAVIERLEELGLEDPDL